MPNPRNSEVQRLQKEKRKAEKKNDLREVAKLCNILGDLLKEQGELGDAICEHESELAISESLDDKIGCAIAHRKIGECQCESGHFKEALKHQHRHLELAKENSDLAEEQRALATIGRTFLYQAESLRDQDEYQNALQSAESAFLKSMAVCVKLQSTIDTRECMQMKARLLLNLGLVHDNKGNAGTCAEYMKRAIKISEMYSLNDDLYRCQFCLVSIYQHNNDLRGALRLSALAQKCAQKLKDKYREGEVLSQKAMLFVQLRDFKAAKRCLRKAKKIGSLNAEEAEKIVLTYKTVLRMNHCSLRLDNEDLTDDQRMKLYDTLGDCAASIGQYQSAVKFYMDMLQVAESLKKPDSDLIPIYVSLAQTYFDMKQYTDAVIYYQRELQCRHDDHNQICRTWLNISEAQELDGATYETLKETYDHAMDSAKMAEHSKLQVHVLRSLVVLQRDVGDTEARAASQRQLERLCEEHDIDTDDDLSDSEGVSHEACYEDEDVIDLEDLTDSDSSNAEEEFARPRVSDADEGGRCRRIRKLKVNEKGETPLHRACIDGKLNIVKALIEGGHTINPRDNCGWLPLHEAANYGYTDIVAYLLDHGARINDRGGDGCGGITPLHDACNCGNVDVTRLLIGRGANIHAKDDEGNTPLASLVDYHRSNVADLDRQDLAELTEVEQLLKRTMQGHNPHMENTGRLADTTPVDDDLPSIRRPPRRRAMSSHKRNREDEGRVVELEDQSEGEEGVSYHDVEHVATERQLPASTVYRDAISAVGSVATRFSQVSTPPSVPGASTVRPVTALIPEEDNVVDDCDWLIEDIVPRKRQRTDIAAVFSGLKVRRRENSEKRPHLEQDSGDLDSDDAIILYSRSPTPPTAEDSSNYNHVSQIQSNARRGTNASRKSAKKQPRIDMFARSSLDRSVLPSSVESSQQPVSNASRDVTSHQTLAAVVMRLRVNIQGKVILVPLPPSDELHNITWLAKEASNRYFQLFNLRPLLSLATKDGAILSLDDLVSTVFTNNEEVLATVTSWDLPVLPTRYTQACHSLQTTNYRNVRNLLHACASSNVLDLHDLALQPDQFLPVARALQCEHRLKELDLSGNRLSDVGLESLCEVASTIPNLSSLNLACNDITHTGLKTLADCLQVVPSDGKKTPFQVLEVLNLSFNPLGDSCLLSLATALHKLPALISLRLASCDFTQTFFQHHRLSLAESMQEHCLESVDFSSNHLSSTGVELLLMSCKAPSLRSIDIASVIGSYHGNYVTMHLQAFVSQPNCALETLVLRDCHLLPSGIPEICSILAHAKFLHTIDLSANTKLNGSALATLLTETARSAICRLTILRCCGCAISSPLPTDFIDGVTEKLNHVTPLEELTFTCSGLTESDADVMTQVWTERWADRAVCGVDRTWGLVRLTVNEVS